MEERLASIMGEIDRMREDSERGAANEKEQLIERAHQESERIAQSAERNIRDEVVRAKHELRRDAVELAVKLAETTLRSSVTRSDQQRLAREFLDSVRGGSNV
jgi:F-type H+-transporting ATPase subunit b